MEQAHILRDLIVVYGVGALVVYVFHRMRQSNIVGFLVTGMLVGPFGLSLVDDTESVHVLAEIGVMLLLFSLGIEFSIKKLMQIRHVVFGTGSIQVALTVAAAAGAAALLGLEARVGVFLGFVVALSSTAIVLRILLERQEMDSAHGRVALGVLIFQDLCVVPMIVIVPLLAGGGSFWGPLAVALVKAGVVIVAVVVLARLVLPAVLGHIMGTRSKELFVIAALWILLAMAWTLSLFGFSLALGAFLAGLTISESEYSHQVFADIRPFRDGLNSLFFISMGMLVNLGFIAGEIGPVLALIAAVIAGKAVLVFSAILVTRLPVQVAVIVGLSMAQIGEFSFVLLQAGLDAGLVPESWYQYIIASAVVTMSLTPFLLWASRKLAAHARVTAFARRVGARADVRALDEAERMMHDHVLVCGFGVTGHNIASVLRANGVPYVILELNPRIVTEERAKDEPIFFGDCTDPTILAHAGITHARVLVLALSDPFGTRVAVRVARGLNPDLVILARNKYLREIDELYDLGATEVVSEEFESSIELVAQILRVYHVPRQVVAQEIKSIRAARYGIFRHVQSTVPRLRLSGALDVYTETVRVEEGSPVRGATIAGANFRQATGALILGVIRESATINNPGPEQTLLAGDLLILSGTKDQLKRAMDLVSGELSPERQATESVDRKPNPA